MKKVLTKFIALGSIGLLMLSACKKDGALVTSNGGKAGTLTASVSTVPLDKSKITDTTKVINFSFTAPNFGFNGAVNNSIQIDSAGDNWAKPYTISLSGKTYSKGFSTPDFNSILLKLNLKAGVASQVNVRVVHSLSTYVTPTYSNVLTLTVTPFNLTSWLWITGQFSGWANVKTQSAEDSLVSVTGNGIYTGIINFPAGENQFLIIPVKGDWSHKYATNDPVNSTSATVTYDAPNNLYAPATAGYYIVTFNSNTGTISFTPADFYTIIGSAPPGTAWQNDYPMKYINDGSGTWVANNVPMIVGEYKFRQDAQWTNSWGPTSTAGTVTDSSPIGDGNIPLTTAGNYNLTFIMPATAYGATPPTTTTYTAVKQ